MGDGRRFGKTCALTVGLLFGLAVFAAPATAQGTPPPNPERTSPFCRVYLLEAAGDQPGELRANCNGRGLMLGMASQYQAIFNDALQATLVDTRLGSRRRVLLLSFTDKGAPLLEDLTGQIALAAGRGPMSELEGVQLDLGGFAATGQIDVRGLPEDTGSAKADKVDVSQQLADERARRAADITGSQSEQASQ